MRAVVRVLIPTLIFSLGSLAHSAECEHEILFIPQVHSVDEAVAGPAAQLENRLHFDEIVGSQFGIARFLEDHPGMPVFSEKMITDRALVWSEFSETSRAEIIRLIEQVFPAGLPRSAEMLTDDQKNQILDLGGGELALMRQKVPSLHPVVQNRRENDEIFRPILEWLRTHRGQPFTPEIHYRVFELRERAALTQINRYFQANPQQRSVVLLFGTAHNFSVYPDLFPPECVAVPSQFQPAWIGRNRN